MSLNLQYSYRKGNIALVSVFLKLGRSPHSSLSTFVKWVNGNVHFTKKVCNVSSPGSNNTESIYFLN